MTQCGRVTVVNPWSSKSGASAAGENLPPKHQSRFSGKTCCAAPRGSDAQVRTGVAWSSAAVAAQPPRKFLRVISRGMRCSLVGKTVFVLVFFRNSDRFRRIIGGKSRRQENGSSAVDPGEIWECGASCILLMLQNVYLGREGKRAFCLTGEAPAL